MSTADGHASAVARDTGVECLRIPVLESPERILNREGARIEPGAIQKSFHRRVELSERACKRLPVPERAHYTRDVHRWIAPPSAAEVDDAADRARGRIEQDVARPEVAVAQRAPVSGVVLLAWMRL
jgi:hypothetical protein